MYRLELSLKVWHSEDGAPYEQVKSISEKLEVGDENHPKMGQQLQGMVRRLFTRLSDVPREPEKKILTPGLVAPTDGQIRRVNRIAGA